MGTRWSLLHLPGHTLKVNQLSPSSKLSITESSSVRRGISSLCPSPPLCSTLGFCLAWAWPSWGVSLKSNEKEVGYASDVRATLQQQAYFSRAVIVTAYRVHSWKTLAIAFLLLHLQHFPVLWNQYKWNTFVKSILITPCFQLCDVLGVQDGEGNIGRNSSYYRPSKRAIWKTAMQMLSVIYTHNKCIWIWTYIYLCMCVCILNGITL